MLGSKKFWAMLGGVLISLGSIATGAQTGQHGVMEAVAILIAYVFAQGVADINRTQ